MSRSIFQKPIWSKTRNNVADRNPFGSSESRRGLAYSFLVLLLIDTLIENVKFIFFFGKSRKGDIHSRYFFLFYFVYQALFFSPFSGRVFQAVLSMYELELDIPIYSGADEVTKENGFDFIPFYDKAFQLKVYTCL